MGLINTSPTVKFDTFFKRLNMHSSWKDTLKPLSEVAKIPFQYVADLRKKGTTIYPPAEKTFAAFEMDYNTIKAVVIGQDPYHGQHQANGLAFSVNSGVRIPPSLYNIYKEINDDTGINMKMDGDLTPWVKQGVLLLNTSLTVEAGKPASHKDIGWMPFVNGVVKLLDKEHNNLVFILWGKHAQEFEKHIDTSKHLVIKSAHPSPYSAEKGFFGSKPFTTCNSYLLKNNKKPIDWQI